MAADLNPSSPTIKKTQKMQLQNYNGEELMSRMQALVRGTLIRRSLMKLRAEFEEISEQLEGVASTGVSTDWPIHTPCRPTFKSLEEDSNVLQRLAKKGWRKPPSSQHSEQSISAVPDPASPQYSSDFQSRSSLSSEGSTGQSSVGFSLAPGSETEGDRHSGKTHSENPNSDSEGSTDVRSPDTTAIKKTTETTEPMVQTRDLHKLHKENSDDPKSQPSAKSDKEAELNRERESAGDRGEEMLEGRVESERSGGNEDDEGCAPVRGGCHGEKIMQRQSLNETDLTIVSSMEASSVQLSSSDDESISADAVDELDHREKELGRFHSSKSLEGQSASIRHNGTATVASDAKTEMDDGHKCDRKAQHKHINLRSSAGQDGLQQSSLLSTKADSPSFSPTSCHLTNDDVQASHSQNINNPPSDVHTYGQQMSISQGTKSEGFNLVDFKQKQSTLMSDMSIRRPLGAVGMDSDDIRQGSVKDDHHVDEQNTSVAADMTSIWSTDLSDNDDEQVPQRDEAKLREMRNNTAMELLWIQQAIESRKNYLRLKSKMSCSNRTDQGCSNNDN